MPTLADLREQYAGAELTVDGIADDPLDQFRHWFNDALDAELDEPNAMILATATPSGAPSARTVLLKGVDERGFIFYTNYESRKARELSQNPNAALVFPWIEIERQVRIEGTVQRLPADESAEYFESRPRGSQLGAWASPQSQVIESRDILEQKLAAVQAKYDAEEPVPCPPHWGGYIVQPTQIEFWQGRPDRLHDRLRYRRESAEEDWVLERLAP